LTCANSFQHLSASEHHGGRLDVRLRNGAALKDGAVCDAALNSFASLLVGLVACMGAFARVASIG
jgi:hypothetical protein